MSTQAAPQGRILELEDTKKLYQYKTTGELIFAYGILKFCSYESLVRLSTRIFNAVRHTPLERPLLAVVNPTFYKQFCSGATIADSKPALDRMAKHGIGTILDYAVESETTGGLDSVVEEILHTIRLSAADPSITFSCAKISGLCTHELLERMTEVLRYKTANLSYDAPWIETQYLTVLPTSGLLAPKEPPPPLSPQHLQELNDLKGRLKRIFAAAEQGDVPLLVDAEQTWLQPAIDYLSLSFMPEYNRRKAIIYNTYQLYLKDALPRLKIDLERARQDGYKFGAKLVRGAYMISERERANENAYPSPIQDKIEDTHLSYNEAAALMIDHADASAVMLATHNAGSLKRAVTHMAERKLPAQLPTIHFAQLYGMCDHLTYALINSGYKACKYVPFGPIEYVVPYLTRRLQENSGLVGRAADERALMRKEIMRRLTNK